jgi:steroid delta-isomerase-like uncharacterized protein
MRKYRTLMVAATALATLAIAVELVCKQAKAQDMDIAQAWIAAWNSHDPDAVLALFTDDAIYEDVTLGVVNHGSAELRGFAEGFFTAVPDVKFDLVNSSVSGNHGFIEWVSSGTDVGIYGTGKQISVRGATIIDLQGDKISRNSDYYDSATILREVGLLPPPS